MSSQENHFLNMNNGNKSARDSIDHKKGNDEDTQFNIPPRMSIERVYADEFDNNEANPTPLRHAKTPNYLERKLQEIHEENLKSIGRDIDLQKTDSELDQDMGLLDKIDNENLDLLDNEAVIIENPVVENQNMEAEDEDGEMVMLNKDEYEASLRAALEKQPARPKPSVNKATIGKGTVGKGTVGKLTTGKATVGKGTVGKEKMILDHEAAQNRTFEVELSDGDEMMILDKEEFERSMRVESSQNASEPEPIQSAQPILILEEEKPVMETETPEPQEEVAVQEVVRDVQVQVQVQAEQNVSTQESVQEPLQKKNTEEEVVLIVPRESEPASGKVSLAKDNVIAPIFLSQKPSVSRLVEINGVRSGVESCKKIGTIVAPGSLSLKNSVAKLNSNKSSVIKIDSNTNTPSGSNKKRKYDAIQESIQQLSNGISGVSQELKKLKKSDTPIQLSNGKTGSLFKQIQQHMLQTPEVKIPNLGIKPSGVKSEVKFMMKENIPNEPNQGSSVKKLEVQNAMKLSSLKPIRTCAFCERPVEKAQSKTLSCLHRAHNDCYITMERRKKAMCPLCNSNTSLMDLKQAYHGVNRAGNFKF